MKKIGILTAVNVDNTGSELQAYALVQKLRLLGYDAEILDYQFSERRGIQKRLFSIMRKFFHLLLSCFNLIRGRFQANKTTVSHDENKATPTLRQQRLCEFWNDTPHSSVSYTREMIFKKPPPYDVFLVGSDQVWNYRFNQDLDVFLLSFLEDRTCCLSYATSIGMKRVPFRYRHKYKQALGNFGAVSLRESDGCRIISDLLCKDVEHVLDPTMLLTVDDWSKEARASEISGSYILLYTVRVPGRILPTAKYYLTGRRSLRNIIAKALELSRRMSMPVVSVSQRYGSDAALFPSEVIDKSDAGPREFLSLMRDAAFVLTNSFHGSAFSINFGRNFMSFSDPECPMRSMKTRLESLLGMFDLSNRLVSTDFPISAWPSDVDYTKVHVLLDEKREESLKWLTDSLEKCSGKKK